MILQLLHSEFPYIWGKFDFLFYQCILCCIYTKIVGLEPTETVRRWLSLICQVEPFGRDGNVLQINGPLKISSGLFKPLMYTYVYCTKKYILYVFLGLLCYGSIPMFTIQYMYNVHCTIVNANLLLISLTKIPVGLSRATYAPVDLGLFKRKTSRCAPPLSV